MRTRAEGYNRKLGLWLFLIYFLAYGGFVALVATDYRLIGRPLVAGVNGAVVYGMALIVGAFVLALVYMAMARKEEG